MSKRIYRLDSTGYHGPEDYYATVQTNPKAKSRIIKKANKILEWLSPQAGINFAFNERARKGEVTFDEWLKRSRQKSFKGNAGINKRRSYSNGLRGAYQSFIEWVNW